MLVPEDKVTCTVAYREGDVVFVGSDSAASNDNFSLSRNDRKVFRIGQYVIGFSGSFRAGQVLNYCFSPSEMEGDPKSHMIKVFIPEMKDALICGGFDLSKEIESSFIVAIRNNIFEIEADFQCSTPMNHYAAIGSGSSFAMGAFFACGINGIKDYKRNITAALRAASKFSGSVKPPFYCLKTKI